MTEFVDQFHFLRPLWLLAVVPLAAICWLMLRAGDPRVGLADDIAPHLLRQLVTTPANRAKLRPATLLPPLGLLAIVCLAGPAFRRQPSPFAEDRSHLVLVVKITPSMLTPDVQPSRLERVRTKIHDLLLLRQGAATGLIAYSGSAHLVMPPTVDSDVIDHMLEALDPAVMPREGDALGDALDLAARDASQRATPGSILIIADSVDAGQINQLRSWRETNKTSVQMYVPLRDDAAVNRSGVISAGDALGTRAQLLTPDDQDINKLAGGADRAFVAGESGEATQWRDDGYLLVPLLVLGTLLWCRRGWSISDD